ncbi:MAG: carboxymuconolactone decarboxylase family protein [Geminicoccaceae bacterium]
MTTERFAPLAEATMTPEQQRVAAKISAGPRGTWRIGPFNALLRSPEIADRIQQVGAYVRFESSIEPRLTELAILLCARRWTAQFEWYAHRKLAIEAGLRPAIADAIAEGRRPADLFEDEAIIHDFAAQLLQAGQVDDAAFAAVCERFGEPGVIDLIATLGYYTTISFVLNVGRVSIPADARPLQPL